MWKAVGTVNPNDQKQNRSKDEVNCQPFTQASRLRLNESQLSGQKSHQFMNDYFTKRKSPEGGLHRVLSQKTIQIRQATSPSASLRQVQSPKNGNKIFLKMDYGYGQQGSLKELQKHVSGRSIDAQNSNLNLDGKYERLTSQLKVVREQQTKIKKLLETQVSGFKQEIKHFQREIMQRIQKIETDRQKSGRENTNPQLLAKIKQEGARFNEKMRDLDSRKEQLKAKYKDKGHIQ